uniref:Uncharacterized protein n=1 Tax=viral metagenome TaxID=1070528 RepID=A0A6M3MBD2_9ZZZZ
MVGPRKKPKKDMTTIWVERDVALELRKLGGMDDTYSTVIRHLLDNKGGPHGEVQHEPAGVSGNKS